MKEKGKLRMRLSVCLICAVLAAACILCGCSQKEIVKTISLPEKKHTERDSQGINIQSIKEYSYEGHTEDQLWLEWGNPDSDTVYMLEYGDKGYTYQKIDIRTKKTVSETFVDDRMIFNVQIAPGGRYISYEAETAAGATPELMLFLADEGKRIVLREWDECLQGFSYVWSDDGTRLFSWQNGDDYAFLPDNNWSVTCYDMETLNKDSKGTLFVEKREIVMDGDSYAWRHVLPNADGSKVYVREEYETFSDSKNGEYLDNPSAKEKMMQENNVEKEPTETKNRQKPANNWILIPDNLEKKKVEEYAKEPICPVKYTKKGLYFQDEAGKLYLVENIEKPSAAELFSVSSKEICICSEGDHLFFVEWTDSMQTLQLSGVRMDGIKPTAKQILYKKNCEGADYYVAADDSALVLKEYGYLENDKNFYHITELRY